MNYITRLLSSWGVNEPLNAILTFTICLMFIVIIAFLAHILFITYLNKRLDKYLEQRKTIWGKSVVEGRLIHRLSHLVPSMIIYSSVPLLSASHLTIDSALIRFIQAIMLLYLLTACIMVFNSIIFIIESIHTRQKGKKRRSIKSYIQVARIIVYFLAGIVAASILIDKSPAALFTGLGAMAAILSLIFKDTISGFIASVQISSYDMVRVGDWIVLPKFGADGDVVEISLNTIKIQNFDKTITYAPTSALLSEGMTNWRGMEEAGGRRIRRSIFIDMKTIKFCSVDLLEKLKTIPSLKSPIENALKECEAFNLKNPENIKDFNCLLSNVTLFRLYILEYLKEHPKVHKEYTLMIRYHQPSEMGLPFELYLFTTNTELVSHEQVQSDIFDYVIASLHPFELKAGQRVSGN
jgi:miniconductance mechanosensitive channel